MKGEQKPAPLLQQSPFHEALPSPPPAQIWGFWRRRWNGECIALFVSFASTAALVAVLYKFNNRPLSDWTSPVTLNAVVAAIVTVAKSSAIMTVASCLSQLKWLRFKTSMRELRDLDLFENASRGPSGAAQLLWHALKRRPDLVAAVGAVLTILALGFDIIAQQLVKSVPREVEIAQGASLGIAYSYDGGVKSGRAQGGSFTPLGSTADIELEGAIYRGIYNITTQDVFACPSRCVWRETYVTLGFASSCTDVTSQSTTTLEERKRYIVETPGGITLEAKFSETQYQAVVNVAALDLLPRTILTSGSIPADFAHIGVLVIPVTDRTNSIIDPSSLQAFECKVGVAAYSYSDITADGSEFIIGNSQKIALDPGEYSWDDAGGSVAFNQAGLPAMKMRAPDLGATASFFTSERFSGSVYEGEGAPTGSQGIGVVLTRGDIPQAFEAMVKSMTAHMRSSSVDTWAQGLTVSSVQYIEVQWYYLIFLLSVQVLSVAFLAMTWHGSRVSHVSLWKGSTVAILCHDLAPGGGMMGTIRTEVESPEQLEEIAQQVKAKLE